MSQQLPGDRFWLVVGALSLPVVSVGWWAPRLLGVCGLGFYGAPLGLLLALVSLIRVGIHAQRRVQVGRMEYALAVLAAASICFLTVSLLPYILIGRTGPVGTKEPVVVGRLRLDGYCQLLAVSPDGAVLAAKVEHDPGGNEIQIWDLKAYTMRARARVPGDCRSLTFSKDGRTLDVLTTPSSEDGPAMDVLTTSSSHSLLDTASGTCIGTRVVRYPPQSSDADSQTESSSGRMFARSFHEYLVEGLQYDLLGRVGDVQVSWVEIWDLSSMRRLTVLRGIPGPVTMLGFSPDDRLLATGSSDEVLLQIWEARTGRLRQTLQASVARTASATFSPDWALVATPDDHLWDLESGKELQYLGLWGLREPYAFFPGNAIMAGTADSPPVENVSTEIRFVRIRQ